MTNIWSYRDARWTETGSLIGYDVETTDGTIIGKIDKSTYDAETAYVVVDTGWWIFDKKRLIPAGAISAIDHDQKRVAVQMTKDQIKSAPDYEDNVCDDTATRSVYEQYDGPFGW